MAESIPITDYKDLRKYFTKRPQNRNPAKSNFRKINAIDTETYRGDVFLIADSDGRFLDKITPNSCLKFLFSRKYENSWNFCYNLGYDAEVILKTLGDKLYSYLEDRKLVFKYANYKIQYIPNKMLSIRKGHHAVSFFDIAQFYKESLAKAYQNNFGKLDQTYVQIKQKRAEFSPWYYKHNKRKVRNYCITDCILTKKLAEKWISLFYNAFLFYPAKWISAGYLAEKVLISNEVYFPKFASIPYEINELALRCYFGGRFEILKRGFIGKAYLYDINSAYPYALTQIPDLTKGRWLRRKSIHKDAKLGFFHILADISDDQYIPPFPFRANGQVIFPSGKFQTYVTLAEIRACATSNYKIIDSWQYVPKSDKYPYRRFILDLYKKRQNLKQQNDPLEKPLKLILNSIYGKTGQKVHRVIGNLFNPVLFSFITGFTRAQLYKTVVENEMDEDVVSFATDAICTTSNLRLNSSKLGQFSLENEADDVYFLQNGFYRFNGKWKQRGLGKLGTKEIENFETYEKNERLYAKFKVLRNSRLRSSIIQNNLEDIGRIEFVEREVNLNADRKRLWLGRLNSLNDKMFVESFPLSLNHIKKEEI